MKIPFEKYHGTGNDFILIDIRNHAIQPGSDIIAHLCDRNFGIGADGLIMLDVSEDLDFIMRYFNADGREASLCGNGGRCITAFASRLGLIKNEALFKAVDGIHHASIISMAGNEWLISLKMADVEAPVWVEDAVFLDTGSPHLVNICKGLLSMDVYKDGGKLRNAPHFGPSGTNVNFIEEIDGLLNIRTYERGVEAETLSCGTGVTAAAIGWAVRNNLSSPLPIRARGGDLEVSFERKGNEFTNIKLQGPASFVFSGLIEI